MGEGFVRETGLSMRETEREWHARKISMRGGSVLRETGLSMRETERELHAREIRMRGGLARERAKHERESVAHKRDKHERGLSTREG